MAMTTHTKRRCMSEGSRCVLVGPGLLALLMHDLRFRRRSPLGLRVQQLVRDVVLVDVADVLHRFAADPLRGDALDVAEPDVGIEAALRRLAPQLRRCAPARRCTRRTSSGSCSAGPSARP